MKNNKYNNGNTFIPDLITGVIIIIFGLITYFKYYY